MFLISRKARGDKVRSAGLANVQRSRGSVQRHRHLYPHARVGLATSTLGAAAWRAKSRVRPSRVLRWRLRSVRAPCAWTVVRERRRRWTKSAAATSPRSTVPCGTRVRLSRSS